MCMQVHLWDGTVEPSIAFVKFSKSVRMFLSGGRGRQGEAGWVGMGMGIGGGWGGGGVLVRCLPLSFDHERPTRDGHLQHLGVWRADTRVTDNNESVSTQGGCLGRHQVPCDAFRSRHIIGASIRICKRGSG